MNDDIARMPEREDFEAWAIDAGFADRDEDGEFVFNRHGNNKLWEAYYAGAARQRLREYPKTAERAA
jgi:predicted transcriptional regulator